MSLVIGLMSGTSADGVDAALVRIEGEGESLCLEELAFVSCPYSDQVLKVFKQHNPSSYPLTILAGPRVLYRMTMPAWGISLGKNGASGSNTLSWDYANKRYFAGAISEQYKSYITYMHKLYAEGCSILRWPNQSTATAGRKSLRPARPWPAMPTTTRSAG